jgi:ABC-type polysaccharide/polyol phosphate export permease
MFAAVADMVTGVSQWRTSYQLGLQDIELRYKRSLLGPFWISGALVAMILALAYVFSGVFRADLVTYIAFIGAGLLAWNLILALTNEACAAVTEHAALLQNVRIPLTTIAGRIAFRNLIVFAHNFIAVAGLLVIFGVPLTPMLAYAVPGAAVILLSGYLLCMVLGPFCARFRDVPLVIQSAMQVIFFLTPIFWMPTPDAHRPEFINGNPFYHLIELVRAPMLGHEPTQLNWQVSLGCLAGLAVLAVLSSALTRKRVPLWL